MLDMHCHILPDVDDGSQSQDESIAMLKAAKEAGITKIICTPHYKDSSFSEDDVFDAFDWFAEMAEDEGLQVVLGYEIHWKKIEELGIETVFDYVIEDTDFALIEFSSNHEIGQLEQRVLWKLKGRGITPIIAHPERYSTVQKNLSLANELKDAGCLLQMSADAVQASMFSPQKKAVKYMLNNNLYDFIASDAHCPEDYEYFIKALQGHKAYSIATASMNYFPDQFMDKIDEYISHLRNTSPDLEKRCLKGDCYQFATHLKEKFGGTLVMNDNRDHVALKIGIDIYDIQGKKSKKQSVGFHDMTDIEEKVASKWRYKASSDQSCFELFNIRY